MRILLVCMGNICRSPMAEGVLRRFIESQGLQSTFEVKSAGTHDYNVGAPPDFRAQSAARRRGYDLAGLRARRVDARDFEHFDHILAMDRRNLAALRLACPSHYQSKLGLFLNYARQFDLREVPDPYYGSPNDFELALDLIEDAAQGLLEALRRS